MAETTVFQSGNSQAVRLPKEFRFKSKTVEIFRRGDEVVLRERPRSVGERLHELFADLPPLTAEDHRALDEAMAIAREPQAQQERDWDALFGLEPKRRSTAKPAAKSTPKSAPARKRTVSR
jgi:antitoxin VapB